MTISKERPEQFKTTTMNLVLIALFVALMLNSPVFIMTSKAVEPCIINNGEYSLNYDGSCLDIVGTIDYSVIDNMADIKEIFVENATIDSSFTFDNKNITHIIFRNCNFTNADFENNKITTKYSFIGCKFDNLDFMASCKHITRLNFDSCEVGNVDALNNLENIEVINFYDVGIENIDFLKNKQKLSQLILANTCVTDLSPIANSNIGFLDISNTLCIQDFSTVLTLKNLYSFYARNCEMSYTKEIYNFVKRNGIESNIKRDDLTIKDEVNKIAQEILNDNMSDDDKILTIVKYVTDNIEYDHNVLTDDDLCFEYNENALKNALNGLGCCKNYSALTAALLQVAGIENYEIRSCDHIWNLVKLEGEYYWIDPTWIDGAINDVEILESSYYMNNNPTFPGHSQLTLPISLYDDVYGEKIENTESDDKDNIIESTTYNDEDTTETTSSENIDLTETTTSDSGIEETSETTILKNTDKAEETETTNLNNNYVDDETDEKTEITTQVAVEENETEQNTKNLIIIQISVGVIIGIAIILVFIKVVKTKKHN